MNPVRFDLCKNLRWKSHSRDSGSPAAMAALALRWVCQKVSTAWMIVCLRCSSSKRCWST